MPENVALVGLTILTRNQRYRRITSAATAAEALLYDWPELGRGEHYREALRLAYACLDGTCNPDVLREVFKLAAIDAGIFVRDRELGQ